jgi:murein DD-endopeptidase MepM/ murein hydrolase activator NlpD
MRSNSYISFLLIATFLASGWLFASAQEGVSEEINALNETISQKKGGIEQINRRIDEYKKKIQKKQEEKASLSVELELLDNRIAKTELEIEETEEEIDLINSEIALLNEQLLALEEKLNQQRQLMSGVLQKIQVKDQEMPLEVYFGSDSLSDLFDEAYALQTVNEDLKRVLEKTKLAKTLVEEKRAAQKTKRDQMEQMKIALEKEEQQQEEEISAQETLIVQTQRSEDAFRALLQELREEQSTINQQIAALQKEIEGKLANSDDGVDSSVLSWPIDPSLRGISTKFHDPTYPFRHLFEHSGLDLPAKKGTDVRAAASGYVAWARTGRLYGNYIMIIHSNGIATLYAHLSRMDVKPDQFVARGSVIGAVGNTGFSTGPHLHFEVRKDGIPTDPIDYLR